MDKRVAQRLAHLEQIMFKHFSSPDDAFRLFDTSNSGSLNLNEFSQLVFKCCEESNETNPPSFPVIKDLFD